MYPGYIERKKKKLNAYDLARYLNRAKLYRINDASELVVAVLVNWRISTGIYF